MYLVFIQIVNIRAEYNSVACGHSYLVRPDKKQSDLMAIREGLDAVTA